MCFICRSYKYGCVDLYYERVINFDVFFKLRFKKTSKLINNFGFFKSVFFVSNTERKNFLCYSKWFLIIKFNFPFLATPNFCKTYKRWYLKNRILKIFYEFKVVYEKFDLFLFFDFLRFKFYFNLLDKNQFASVIFKMSRQIANGNLDSLVFNFHEVFYRDWFSSYGFLYSRYFKLLKTDLPKLIFSYGFEKIDINFISIKLFFNMCGFFFYRRIFGVGRFYVKFI